MLLSHIDVRSSSTGDVPRLVVAKPVRASVRKASHFVNALNQATNAKCVIIQVHHLTAGTER